MKACYDLSTCISDYWNAFDYDNIEIEVEISDEVSRTLTKEERDDLTQIFANLRSNAIKAIWGVEQEEEYTEHPEDHPDVAGKIMVTARRVDDLIEISIVDNGHGIQAGHIEQVLAGTWSKRLKPVKRTVRGMHLIHRALDRLGGSIQLESEYGSGTTFYVYLSAEDGRD